MNTIYTHTYQSPFGEILLGDYKNELVLADWNYRKMHDQIDHRIKLGLNAVYQEEQTDLHRQTIFELEEYFIQKRKNFSLPLKLVGTDFQKKVWENLLDIPFGETLSYLKLAQKMTNELAIRAIASANGANAISIIIPCHRIIGNSGQLVGYAGNVAVKRKLLQLENALPQLEIDF
jgi:methylated-DNA-[protein]-cysteine S-methyltransferase